MRPSEGVTVLYVDDDPEFADIVSYWLDEDEGEPPLSVRVAGGTREALETLGTESVDCVVSDYAMPDRDGIQLLESLRERQTALPFILFTAHGGEETARDAFRAGVTDYMQKGGDRETVGLLAERIRAAVRDRRQSGEPRDHVQYRAGVREVALDAATSLMSATPDELDAKIRFTLESLCEYMDLARAATYRAADEGYERRHGYPDETALAPTLAGTGEGWVERLETFETVTYGPEGTHPNAEETLAPRDRSGVVAPMISGWELDGAVVFD
ncbi:MAG: response regulator, partial [Halobaculum sp.]